MSAPHAAATFGPATPQRTRKNRADDAAIASASPPHCAVARLVASENAPTPETLAGQINEASQDRPRAPQSPHDWRSPVRSDSVEISRTAPQAQRVKVRLPVMSTPRTTSDPMCSSPASGPGRGAATGFGLGPASRGGASNRRRSAVKRDICSCAPGQRGLSHGLQLVVTFSLRSGGADGTRTRRRRWFQGPDAATLPPRNTKAAPKGAAFFVRRSRGCACGRAAQGFCRDRNFPRGEASAAFGWGCAR
jgi:hypothetical protein